MEITVVVAVALLINACRRVHPDSEARGVGADALRLASSEATPQRAFVEIIGKRAALVAAGLAQMDGVLFDEHAVTPLDGDRVRVAAYVTSEHVVDRIRATGLTVTVLQTADQVREEEERIVRRLGAREAQ